MNSWDPAANTALADNGGAYFPFETGKNVNPTYLSPSPPVSIPDNTTVVATASVPDVNVVQDVNVKVNITHARDSDLTISLTSPDNFTTVVLSAENGETGRNYTNTVFDDEVTRD